MSFLIHRLKGLFPFVPFTFNSKLIIIQPNPYSLTSVSWDCLINTFILVKCLFTQTNHTFLQYSKKLKLFLKHYCFFGLPVMSFTKLIIWKFYIKIHTDLTPYKKYMAFKNRSLKALHMKFTNVCEKKLLYTPKHFWI